MLFPRWHFLPFSPFCASPPSVLFFLLVFLPSFSYALYIVRMEYIPVELLDEFSDGRGTVSREKRRAESPMAEEEAEDEYDQEQLPAVEMALMDRAYKAKLRQLAEEEAEEEEENERRDREELAQRWDTLRRTIEDNVKRMEDGEGQRREENDDEDEDGTEKGREKEGEGEGQIVLASQLGSDDYGPAEIVPLAMVVDGGQRPRAQRRSGGAGGEEAILLEL